MVDEKELLYNNSRREKIAGAIPVSDQRVAEA